MALLACAIGLSLSYWPGLITYDSKRQYNQALTGWFDDWHPPMMEAIWWLFIRLWYSPAPMLLLQLALHAGGFALMIRWALARARPRLAIGIAACAFLPISLAQMGVVEKDSLMSAMLVAAAGLALEGLEPSRRRPVWSAIILVLLAATIRFNAFAAGLPIILAAVGPTWRATRRRLALTIVSAIAALGLAMPLANAALLSGHTDVRLSLIIFDLAGISHYSGENAFPPLPVSDPMATVESCYSPIKWDNFSMWAQPICPINIEAMRHVVHDDHVDAGAWLAREILQHPLAYAQHRLAHLNMNLRFLVSDGIARPVARASAPNIWGFHVSNGPLVRALDGAAVLSGTTALGWPCVWVVLAASLFHVSRNLPHAAAIRMLAGSGLLYGLAYTVVSVASELRYYLWTMIAVALAAVIASSDLGRLPARTRRPLCLAIAIPPALVALMALAARQWVA